jgi:hypothetical protein
MELLTSCWCACWWWFAHGMATDHRQGQLELVDIPLILLAPFWLPLMVCWWLGYHFNYHFNRWSPRNDPPE